MKQLSGQDNLFLLQERDNQLNHVAGLAIYDPSTAPGGAVRFKAILDFFTRRLNNASVFRRRLVRTPLDLDRPYWIEEPTIDIEYHVRHIALPKPGDWRQLMILISRIHARPIDFAKPAWEAYVIEGLNNIPGVPPGSFAMYTKFHHAAIDGQTGARLIGMLHSQSPEPEPAPMMLPVAYADREPSSLELLMRTVVNQVKNSALAVSMVGDLAPIAYALGRKQLSKVFGNGEAVGRADVADHRTETREKLGKRAPLTRFSAALSPHRVVEAVPLPLDAIQRIREAVPGTTVNDIFLSVSSGAVRSYLLAKGELPATSLKTMMPMSASNPEKGGDGGNQVGLAVVPIYSDIGDAGERLRKISQRTAKGKKAVASVGKDLPVKLFQVLPGKLADLAARKLLVPQFNIVVSNVRGPSMPLYMAGAKLVSLMPVSMLFNHVGLNLTGFSYDGILWVCVVADRVAMPDPGFFAQCLRESFEAHTALSTVPAAVRKKPAKRSKRPA